MPRARWRSKATRRRSTTWPRITPASSRFSAPPCPITAGCIRRSSCCSRRRWRCCPIRWRWRLAGRKFCALSRGHRRDPAAGCGARTPRSRGSGCRSPRHSPPSSSISATARTAFSPRDCWARRCWRLPRRPILSGILFGLLAYKPQFGLLIPVALLVAGQWRAMIAAGLTVIALTAAATLAFGTDIWWAFAASTETSRKLLLEQGDVGFEKLQSVFAAIRLWGGGVPLAYACAGRGLGRSDRRRGVDVAHIRRSRPQGRAVDDRNAARLAARARLRPHHPRAGDGVLRCLELVERFPRFRHQRCWRRSGSCRCWRAASRA